MYNHANMNLTLPFACGTSQSSKSFASRICSIAALVACVIISAIPAVLAQPATTVASAFVRPTSVLAVDLSPHIQGTTGNYYFGSVSALDMPKVQQTFTLHNHTKMPIVLDRLVPSCYCTTAIITRPGQNPAAPSLLPTVLPGGQATVQVTVDIMGQPVGNLTKSVDVYAKGNSQPVAQLLMIGVLLPTITFSPALLDFGTVPMGQALVMPLTVQVDSRLWAAHPSVIVSNPDIRLDLQPTVVASDGNAAKKNRSMHTLSYRVTLLPSAIGGPISGSVSVIPPSNLSTVAPTLPAEASTLFSYASVQLTGQVQADVIPSPQMLAIGTVAQGKEAIRQIVMTGKTAQDVTGLKAVSPSEFISARILEPTAKPANGQPPSVTRVLEISLLPTAPLGTLQTQVKVTLGNGHRLLIPITAYVSSVPLP